MRHGLQALVLLVCIASVSPASAVQLIVDDRGRLRGATDVQVGVGFYSVRFVESSCYEVHPTCNDSTIFPFPDPYFARAASEALLEQVFLDGPEGPFDSDPLLTWGCAGMGTSTRECDVWTFYAATGSGDDPPFFTGRGLAYVAHNNVGGDWFGGPLDIYGAFDFGGPLVAPFSTIAVWSGPPWQAPEPGTLALLGLGLVGIGLSRRRKAA